MNIFFKRVFSFFMVYHKSKTTKNQFTNVDNLSIQKQHFFKMNISKLWLQVTFTGILFTFNGINQQNEFYIYAKMYLLISVLQSVPTKLNKQFK
jgi:predicted small secreted protein